jgi:DNA topoisomerase IB
MFGLGDDYSVKDLRTWHGTVLAAAAFADADPAVSQRVAKRVEAAVMREVAEELGNTPSVRAAQCGARRGPVHQTRRSRSWRRPPAC